MPIPDFQTLMLPLLEALSDGQERLMRDVTAQLADRGGTFAEVALRREQAVRQPPGLGQGNDEVDELIAFHHGDQSDFVARRATAPRQV
jgi:hypothetical protein